MGAVPSDGEHPKVRGDGLVVEHVGDELLVYDRERDKAHCLNDTAALVFSHCDGERSVCELAAQLSAESGRPIDEDVVGRALVRLSDEHLLEEPVSATGGREWSRRQVLVRVGVAGAAAGVGLPVVKSVVAPTAAHAQSCVPQGGVCGTPDSFGACQQTAQCCPTFFCVALPRQASCTCLGD